MGDLIGPYYIGKGIPQPFGGQHRLQGIRILCTHHCQGGPSPLQGLQQLPDARKKLHRALGLQIPGYGMKELVKALLSRLGAVPGELGVGILNPQPHGLAHRLPVRLRETHGGQGMADSGIDRLSGIPQRVIKIENNCLIVQGGLLLCLFVLFAPGGAGDVQLVPILGHCAAGEGAALPPHELAELLVREGLSLILLGDQLF